MAERVEPERGWCGATVYQLFNAVVYTADHLPLGRVWQTTILSTSTGRWDGGLVSGCVSLSVYFTSSSSTLDEDSALVARQ